MNLPEFLEHQWPDLEPMNRYREMAKLLGCHRFYVYQMATGRRFPSLKMMLLMEQVSDGKITLRDGAPRSITPPRTLGARGQVGEPPI